MPNPSERLSAVGALQHLWLSGRAVCQAPSVTVVQNICAFSMLLPLHRQLRTVAARQFGHDTELQSQFLAFASSTTGTIGLPEFEAILLSIGASTDEAQTCFAALSVRHSCAISFTQFLAAAVDARQFEGDICRLTFELFDLDRDGLVKGSELKQKGLEGVDTGDRGISLHEFSHLLTCQPEVSVHRKHAIEKRQVTWLHCFAWCGSG